MLRPQMLEAIFVAGSLFVGMTGNTIHWAEPAASLLNESRHVLNQFAYQLISITPQIEPQLLRKLTEP